MEKLIIIACVALVLGIIAFGAYQFRKLRSRWADSNASEVHGQDADRIVYAYRVEEGYIRQRSRIWLLTIMVSAVVSLLGFGSVYYLHHKDVWAMERAEKAKRKAQEKTLEKERAEAEKAKRKAQEKALETDVAKKVAPKLQIEAQNVKTTEDEVSVHEIAHCVMLVIFGLLAIIFMLLYFHSDHLLTKEQRKVRRLERDLQDWKIKLSNAKLD